MRERTAKYDHYYVSTFKYCKESDFVSKSLYFGKSRKIKLCPDIGKNEEKYKVKGNYGNEILRHSFQIEFVRCVPTAKL